MGVIETQIEMIRVSNARFIFIRVIVEENALYANFDVCKREKSFYFTYFFFFFCARFSCFIFPFASFVWFALQYLVLFFHFFFLFVRFLFFSHSYNPLLLCALFRKKKGAGSYC